MKILRSTLYFSPNSQDCNSLVLREVDCQTTVEEAAASMAAGAPPGAFVASEVFEIDGTPSLVQAAYQAERRRVQGSWKLEVNQAIMFYYDAAQLRRVSSRGILAAPSPAPMTGEQAAAVFRQLARHPNYQQQLVMTPTEDGQIVVLRAGVVEIKGLDQPLPRS